MHALVELSRTVDVATVVKHLKGASSHFVNHAICPDVLFRWQRLYAAFTVGERGVGAVKRYVISQRERHSAGRTIDAWELPPPAPAADGAASKSE